MLVVVHGLLAPICFLFSLNGAWPIWLRLTLFGISVTSFFAVTLREQIEKHFPRFAWYYFECECPMDPVREQRYRDQTRRQKPCTP